MPNAGGRYKKAEAYASGLLIYIPSSKRWTSKPFPFAIFLSRSRLKALKLPILQGQAPSAFLYAPNAGMGTGELQNRYIPLYDATDEYFLRRVKLDQLYEREIMSGEGQ